MSRRLRLPLPLRPGAVRRGFAAAVLAACAALLPAGANPSLTGPSGLITIPTAPPEGGFGMHTAADSRRLALNLELVTDLLEVGAVRDGRTGTTAWNAKLALLSEDGMIPAVSVGAYGFSSADEDSSRYLVASKNLPVVGGTVHAGFLMRGRMKSLAALYNYTNPIRVFQELSEEDRAPFYGLEYPLLPLLSVMGESVDGRVNAGVRVSPVAGLVIDWDYLDVRNRRDLKDRRLVHLKYRFGF